MRKLILIVLIVAVFASIATPAFARRPFPERPWLETEKTTEQTRERDKAEPLDELPGCGINGEFFGGTCEVPNWLQEIYHFYATNEFGWHYP